MTYKNPGLPNVIKWHDGPEDFHDYCSNPAVRRAHAEGKETVTTNWGGVAYSTAMRDLLYGSIDRAILAQQLFDDVVHATMDTLGRSVITSSVVGSTPNVPAMLAGLPHCMLERSTTEEKSSNAPIRIVIDLFASCGITQQQFIRRGVAALAFTMVMNTVRPIDLYVAHTGASMHIPGSSVAHVIKIDTKPLDLPRAVWMISDPAFFRRLGFCAMMYELKPWLHPKYKTIDYLDDCIPCAPQRGKEQLQLDPNDIYIERLLYGNIPAIENPIEWVNSMVKQHMVDQQMAETELN